jgi:hypothetical protein
LTGCSPPLNHTGSIYIAKFSYNETALKNARPVWLNDTFADTLNVTNFAELEIRVGFSGFCASQANSHLCATTAAGLAASKKFLDPMDAFEMAKKFRETLSPGPYL